MTSAMTTTQVDALMLCAEGQAAGWAAVTGRRLRARTMRQLEARELVRGRRDGAWELTAAGELAAIFRCPEG